jgi:hypothetical protein
MTKRPGEAAVESYLGCSRYLFEAARDFTAVRFVDSSNRGRAPLSYRHDRRGHERCYVRRGPLPLDGKRKAKLERAGYKIWTVGALDAETHQRLAERELPPKRTEEWLALLTRWIDHQVVGAPGLPYIPAVRVSGRKRRGSEQMSR